jgi:UDP-glucuronate 4-epimerase
MRRKYLKSVFITGTAGFIGFHLAQLLLDEGMAVTGYDGMSDYYDVNLKKRRHQRLLQNKAFVAHEGQLEDMGYLQRAMQEACPDVIVHLAAQAGVRYSMEAPRDYINTNLVGAFNVLECARDLQPGHLLMASTSSVYGAISEQPFHEGQKIDSPLNIYAASKAANEHMAHAYANLYDLPTTMFRFFTVYGPWGRPDMALFKFVESTLKGEEIDVYNNGEMARDFTYVTDLVRGIRLLMDAVPPAPDADRSKLPKNDSLSVAAPFRVVNIGNSTKVPLLEYIDAIEQALGMRTRRNYLPMQPGEVLETYADASLLQALTGYRPETDVKTGVRAFVDWYRKFYNR